MANHQIYTSKKLLIIGGGIGGLMTAIALNKKGIPPTIYVKANVFDAHGAGLAMWANATSIFDKLIYRKGNFTKR